MKKSSTTKTVYYWLFNSKTNRYEKKAKITDQEAEKNNRYFSYEAKNLSHYKWVIPVLPDLKGRHLASLRSICETFGKCGKSMCVCGKECSDSIHFTTEEWNKLSPEEKMVANGSNL